MKVGTRTRNDRTRCLSTRTCKSPRATPLAIVLLLTAASWAAPAIGTSSAPATPPPTVQDDAGSGGDAGDTSELALDVANGRWNGTLVDPVDRNDWFRLVDVEAQQRIQVTFASTHPYPYLLAELRGPPTADTDADPVLYRRVQVGGDFELPIAHDGPWYLRVSRVATPVSDQSPAVAYTLDVQSRHDPDQMHHVGDAPSLADSISWDDPAHLAAYIRIETPVDPTRPTAGAILLEHDIMIDGRRDSTFSMYAFESGGTGTPAVERIHLAGAQPASGIDVFQTVGLNVAVTYLTIDWPNSYGTVRWTAYMTAENATVSLAASVGPHDATTTDPDAPLAWTTDDTTGEQDVAHTPGLRLAAPDRLELDTGPRFVGLFDTHDVGGYAVAPDGTRHDVSAGRYLFLIAPMAGTWTFHVDGRADIGRDAISTYLHGARAPIDDDMPTISGPLPA